MHHNHYPRRCLSVIIHFAFYILHLLRCAFRIPHSAFICSLLFPAAIWAQDEVPTESAPSATPTAPPTPTAPQAPSTSFTPTSVSGYVGMTPSTPLAGTSQLSVSPPSTLQSTAMTGGGLYKVGPVVFHPHLQYDVSYGDNLQPVPGQKANTLINQVSPGLLLVIGDHWTLDYTPILRFYSSPHFQNGVDHIVNFAGGTTYQDWSFGLQQGYAFTSQPLIETGSQLSQETFSTLLNASHALNSKVSLDFNVNQNFRFVTERTAFSNLTDTREWSTLEWLNYQVVPRLTAGIGIGFTYDDVSVGPDMTSEQFQGRVVWHPTEKLNFVGTAGGDLRQFLVSGASDLLSPTFSISALYQLFEPTRFSLSANRSISPSYFQYALSELTTVSAGLEQRLLKRLYLDVSGGYSSTTYHATTGLFNQNLATTYDSTSFNVRLSTAFLRRATAAIFFQQTYVSSAVKSSLALYNYSTTQVGLSLTYRF